MSTVLRESQNNDPRGDDAEMEASIEKFRYNEMSQNNDRKCADQALSKLWDFTVLQEFTIFFQKRSHVYRQHMSWVVNLVPM